MQSDLINRGTKNPRRGSLGSPVGMTFDSTVTIILHSFSCFSFKQADPIFLFSFFFPPTVG